MKNTSTVHVNKKTYDMIIKQLNYVPENLRIGKQLEDNKAVVFNEDMSQKYISAEPLTIKTYREFKRNVNV